MQNELNLATKAQGQISAILADLDGACRYIIDGEKQHPNRWDVCDASNDRPRDHGRRQQRTTDFRMESGNPFGQPPDSSAFRTRVGAQDAKFGKSTPVVNPFGARPPQTVVNPFNQPPRPQNSQPGQTSVPQSQSPYRQASAAKPVNPFGQPPPTDQQVKNPFGQPLPSSGFGEGPRAINPFGQPPKTNGFENSRPSNPFGQPPPSGQVSMSQLPSSTANSSQSASTGFSRPIGTSASAPTTNRTFAPVSGARIFDKPPDHYADTEAAPEEYGSEGSDRRRILEEIYRKARELGRFEGDVPEEPPLHKWRSYDL